MTVKELGLVAVPPGPVTVTDPLVAPAGTFRKICVPLASAEKLALVNEYWSPAIVGRLNDYKIQVVKVKGEFTWHTHAGTDEFFLVLDGELAIRLRDREVRLNAGEVFVVPRGVEHCPFAETDCQLLVIEPSGTVNTGEAGGDLTTEERSI